MAGNDPQAMAGMLTALLQPWHNAVDDPPKAQQEVLHNLLRIYAQTDYGARHGAAQIETIEDYRRSFPIATYEDYRPLIQRVMAGETELLLSEEPVGWAITRGTTKGESKFIPMTPTEPALTALYGPVAIREIYGTTEGMFGQQRDAQRAWVPNYDLYFFEIETDAARDATGRDGQPGRLDAGAAPLQDRRPDPRLPAALFPVHRS